ncbi:MAG: SDR family NAD(P)-dependent oxidoreductase [Thermoleophilia bacterium]
MRTVLITGASRGIGRACVHAFAGAGWRVVAGVRDPATAGTAFAGLTDVHPVTLDVTDAERIPVAVREAQDIAGGALACVVPNAGFAQMSPAEHVDLDVTRLMFETNLFGHVTLMQHALPAMREAGSGSVVCVTSIGARVVHPLLSMYHASKYAMTAWAEGMRVELRPFGLRVHVVEPGMVDTEFPAATRVNGPMLAGEGPYAPLLDQMRVSFPAWRAREGLGPGEVAAAVLRAAEDPAAPFRIVSGSEAERLGAARERLGDEAFHDWLLDFLGVRWEPGSA